MYLSLAGDFWFKKRFHSRFLVLEQHPFSLEIEFQRNFHLAGISFRDLVLERTLINYNFLPTHLINLNYK